MLAPRRVLNILGGLCFFLEIVYFTLDWFLSFTVTTLYNYIWDL